MNFKDKRIVVVGSGFFGLTLAERIATQLGQRVLVVEKRKHIGGNAWSEIDEETGIEVHKYGTHILHTSNQSVWDYLNQFSRFTSYRHQVWTVHKGKLFPMPINLATISLFYDSVFTPEEAKLLIAKSASEISGIPSNLEEKAISSIGRPLYEGLIRGYSAKQWQVKPSDLPASIISRLPVRYSMNLDYFDDPFQGMPEIGYGELLLQIAKNPLIEIRTNLDFFEIKEQIDPDALLIYTGAIDRYFGYRLGQLGWRTLDFENEVLDIGSFQGSAVLNYADEDVPFTRIHEFKHLHPERKYSENKTFISREYSRIAFKEDEPYYPISASEDKARLQGYRELANREKNVIFGGRLGSYQYLDMHMAIASALVTFENQVRVWFERNKA